MTHSNWIRGALSVWTAMGILLSNAPMHRAAAAPLALPPLIDLCFVETTGDGTTDGQSPDSAALQTALAAASAGAVIKIAGHCAGSPGGQAALVEVALTLRGGYTTANWLAAADPVGYPTRVDPLYDGYAVKATAPVTLENLILQNGFGNDGAGARFEAEALLLSTTITNNVALGNGSGIYALASIVMISSTVVSNTANNGGGAYFAAAATITGTTFQSNTASVDSGGGAFFNGPASVYRSQFIANSVQNGNSDPISDGGGAIFRDDVLVQESLFRGNSVQGLGGNISVQGPCSSCRIESTRLIGGSAGPHGGGLAVQTNATIWLVNNLFANNVAEGESALWFFGPTAAGTLHAVHNTFYGADQEVTIGTSSSGFSADTGYFTNTVLAGDNAALIAVSANSASIKANGLLIDTDAGAPRGWQGDVEAINVITGSAGFVDAANLDLRMTGAGVDAGINAGVNVDIDSAVRPQGSGYDLGAFEYTSIPVCFAETTGDNTTDFSSANASALQNAVSAAAANGTVKIAGVCTGVQTLGGTTQTMLITKSLTLIGGYSAGSWTSAPTSTSTIDANQLGRAILATAVITVQNLVFTGGNMNMVTMPGFGGAVFLQFGGNVVNSEFLGNQAANSGGALATGATTGMLMVSDSSFLTNTSGNSGGAVFTTMASTVTQSSFERNSASAAGGAIASLGRMQLISVDFYTNTGGNFGGSLYLLAANNLISDVQIISSTGNTGGALYALGATEIYAARIQHATAVGDGGAIWIVPALKLTDTTISDASATNGGGVMAYGDVQIFGGSVTSNTATANGGGIRAASLTLHETTIASNTAALGGGFYAESGAQVYDSSLLSNTADSKAAAVMSASGSNASVLVRSIVQDNVATGTPGGVLVSAAALNIESSRVVSNAVTSSSGSGLIAIGGDAVITDTVIERNAVTGVTGGVSVQGALTMRNTQVLSNTLAGDGTLYTSGLADIADSRFAGNVVSGQGGAIDASGTTTLTNVSLISNTAVGDGGGARFGSTAVVQGGEVLSNVSTAGYGGGLYWGKTDANISGTLIADNAAPAGKGGGASAGGAAYVENSTFERNFGGSDGGALFSAQSAWIVSSEFLSNTTVLSDAYAGAVRTQASLYITDSTFVGNTNERGYAGAAAGTTFVEVRQSTFTGNTGGEGGAVLSEGAADVDDSTFGDNVAARSNGGALTAYGVVTATKSTFQRNSAAGHGGAVYGSGGLLQRSQLRHNAATMDGGGAYFAGDVEVTNNVFAGNSAGEAGDLYFSAGLRGSHNTFSGTGTALSIGGVSSPAPAVGVLTNSLMAGYTVAADAEVTGTIELRGLLWDGGAFASNGAVTVTQKVIGSAKFANAGADSYIALGAGVDAGVDSGVSVDIRGESRPKGAGYDMGAYEVGPEVVDATLGDLEIAPGALAPAFVSTTASYTAAVAHGITTVRITPTVNVEGATYVITSAPGLCSPTTSPADCALEMGMNVITVVVTSLNGAVVQTYTVEIERVPSSDATLGGLTIAPGTLSPAFVSGTTAYTASVPNGTTSVMVTATANDAGATVAYTSSTGACVAGSCAVTGPKTWITVTVTAADGSTQEYVVEIIVAASGASSDAMLGGLTIAPGTLSPAFVSGTTAYSASVPNGTTNVVVTATANDAGATVAYASSAGACAAGSCAVTGPKTWITVTVTAADGSTQEYVVEIIVAAPLTAIGRVWPTLGVPEGGMPVTLFGTGFSVATGVRVSNSITNVLVLFTVTGDGRIDFVMPAGVDGTWADITVETASGSTTVSQAFWYQAPVRVEIDGETGAVITLTSGVVITVPAQGVSGTLVITLTPVSPQAGLPGSVLLHVFQLEALLNAVPIGELNVPIRIALPVDPATVPAGEQPWLYQWTVVGSWAVVRGTQYDPAAAQMQVSVRPMGLYALSTVRLLGYWLPLVPRLK